jgi:epoxyqueuosine reductase
MDKVKNHSELKNFCLGQDVDLFGVAGVSQIKDKFSFAPELVRGLDWAVILGMQLSEVVLSEISDCPTRLYSYHYRTVNLLLDQIALKMTIYLRKAGYRSLPIPASQVLDWQKHTAHLSHRKIGALAGLGWIGRNNLLVNPVFGSRIRLVTVLTDMPLAEDAPVKADCGICRRCITACPAGAIKEGPEDFDQTACLAKLKEFQKKHIVEQYICGVCVRACAGSPKP